MRAFIQILLLFLGSLTTTFNSAYGKECVVLLHGLARSARSMSTMEESLIEAGYLVANVNYPSRKNTVEHLATVAVTEGLRYCRSNSATSIHFVTHSMGGILVRQYVADNDLPEIGNVVTLGPPNQVSEVVDHLRNIPGFSFLNGPAGAQLGTGKDGITKSLGRVNFSLGVIAGTKSVNWILSSYLPNPNDGKVSVASTQVEGMASFITLPVSHTFMMQNKTVIEETIYFLQHGRFLSGSAFTHP